MINIDIPQGEWDAILAKFDGMAMKVKKEIAYDALYNAVLPTVEAVRDNCPVFEPSHPGEVPGDQTPGTMKASIGVAMRRYKTGVRAIIGPLRGFPGEPAAVAHLVEYGHRSGNAETGKLGKLRVKGLLSDEDVQPHPFLRPAWEATKGEVMPRLAKLLGEGIEGYFARRSFKNTTAPTNF